VGGEHLVHAAIAIIGDTGNFFGVPTGLSILGCHDMLLPHLYAFPAITQRMAKKKQL
jgi:hypothetical protein